MFEFMSAMALVASLQTTPEQLKIAKILDRYEKVAMEPKALRVEFNHKVIDAVTRNAKTSEGLFALQRMNSDLSFFAEIKSREVTEKAESFGLINREFTYLNKFVRRIKNLNESRMDQFRKAWVQKQFPLSDIKVFVGSHNIMLVKEDEHYSYVMAIPNSSETGKSLRPYYNKCWIVFMRKQSTSLPMGSLRRLEVEWPDYDVISYDIKKWQIDSTEDATLFPIRAIPIPEGSHEIEMSPDGKIWLPEIGPKK